MSPPRRCLASSPECSKRGGGALEGLCMTAEIIPFPKQSNINIIEDVIIALGNMTLILGHEIALQEIIKIELINNLNKNKICGYTALKTISFMIDSIAEASLDYAKEKRAK